MATPTTGNVLSLEVASPKGLMLSTQATSVQAPGTAGEFGVLPGHLPILAGIRPGVLKYVTGGKAHVAAVGRGYFEGGPDRALLLVSDFQTPESIDVDAVKKELADAEKELKSFGEAHEGAAFETVNEKVQWAQARLLAATLPH